MKIIKWILSRVRRQGKTKPQSSSKWGFYCAVITLDRPITSSIGAYRIVSIPGVGSHDIVLTLDYLPELQLLEKQRNNANSKTITRNQIAPNNSFRFTLRTVWYGGNDDIIFIADIDLLGSREYNIYTSECIGNAFRETAYHSLKISHNSRTLDTGWQSQINRVNWLGLLEREIKYYLKDENHNLNAIIRLNNRPSFF